MEKIVRLASVLLFFLIMSSSVSAGEDRSGGRYRVSPALSLTAGFPGVGIESGDRLLVALPIMNEGKTIAQNVRVTSATLAASQRLSPKAFPVALGDIAPEHDVVFEASFSVNKLKSGNRQLLVIRGICNCRDKGTPVTFTLRKYITIPMRSGESAILRFTSVKSEFGIGAPYPDTPVPGSAEERTNEEKGPPIPTGTRRGNLQPSSPQTNVVPGRFADTRSEGPLDQLVRSANAVDDPVVFVRATQTAVFAGVAPDASGASSNNVVLHSYNGQPRFSTDGGVGFAGQLSRPGNPNVDGGYCCDDVIIYIPKIDRFVWLMQFWRKLLPGEKKDNASGPNRYRVAVASPQQVIDSNGQTWMYFDLTSGLFGFGNDWMDYPDLAVGNKFLHFSANVKGVNAGRLVGRIPLSDLKNGGVINIGFTGTPLSMASHLAQNITSTAYLAGHNTGSTLRIFSFPENSPGYSVHDVGIDTWPGYDKATVYSSLAPNGQDWLNKLNGFPRGLIIGATRLPRLHCVGNKSEEGDELWLAWTAAKGGEFEQPHVQLVKIDTSNYSKLSQEQIRNNKLAFAYPALAVNSRNEVGVAIAVGGGGSHSNFGVSIYGEPNIYLPPLPPTPQITSHTRYGDYFAIRRDSPNEGIFSAFGLYFTLNDTSEPTCCIKTNDSTKSCGGVSGKKANCSTNLSYIRFGRKSAVNNEQIPEKCSKEEICKCKKEHGDCITNCETKRDACMKPKPGNPLPSECAQEFNECRTECGEMLKLCQAKCK